MLKKPLYCKGVSLLTKHFKFSPSLATHSWNGNHRSVSWFGGCWFHSFGVPHSLNHSSRETLRGCGIWNSRSWIVSARPRHLGPPIRARDDQLHHTRTPRHDHKLGLGETDRRTHRDSVFQDAYLLSTLKRSMHKAGG